MSEISRKVEVRPTAPKNSQDEMAEIFINTHCGTLKWVTNQKRWYEWDGAAWRGSEIEIGLEYARETLREIAGGKPTVTSLKNAQAVCTYAKSSRRMAIEKNAFDADEWLLGTPSGTVNLRTGRLLKAQPDQMITKLTGAAPQPGEPTQWLEFLRQVTNGDQEVIDFLQEWCGYNLTGSTEEQVFLFVHGGGGNGKSVFVNTVMAALGDYADVAPMDTFTASSQDKHSTEIAMLHGARMVSASETEEGRAWAEAKVKQLSGGDKVKARFMFRDFFEFKPQFKLTVIGNHAPVLQNVDDAMRRRFRVLPFNYKPATPDKSLEAKLLKELPQILQWMVDGCVRWQGGGLSYPKTMQVAVARYFESQDFVGQFIETCCEVGSGRWETKKTLFEAWRAFCKDNGEEVSTQRRLSQQLLKRGFEESRMLGAERLRTYTGLTLKARPGGQDGY